MGQAYNRIPVKRRRASKLLYIVAAILFFGVLITFVNIHQLRSMHHDYMGHAEVEGQGQAMPGRRPRVWVYGKHVFSGYLDHVFAVFDRIGYSRGSSTSWDVLWSHDYPFSQLKEELLDLKPHQKINHFPGSGYVTNKLNLATSDIQHIPRAFKLPKEKDDFIRYAEANPKVKWVQKNGNHRGIEVKKTSELDLNADNTIVQEYIEDPLLIDGRRFDIGIYTTLTGIDPLRVYINEGDWLLRFCPKEYYPFDPNDKDKYVVHDAYLPLWEVDSLKPWFVQQGYNFRETFLAYLRSRGLDTEKLDQDIRETIRSVFLAKEEQLINASKRFKSTDHFFEMVRFDFVLDSQMNIYLMEVNMSPNLSSGHFPPNKYLYEHTVYGMLHLVGVARSLPEYVDFGTEDERVMQVSQRDILTNPDSCRSPACLDDCKPTECRLCSLCLNVEQKAKLRRVYEEHVSRRNWRRVLPATWSSQEAALEWSEEADVDFSALSTRNQWLLLWFRGKCLQDPTWCF